MRTKLVLTVIVLALALAGCGGNKTATPAATEEKQPPTMQQTNLPKLWDFWATWCPPCKELKPTIEALAEEYKGVIEITSIDVDQQKDLAQKFGVTAVPTLVFLDKDGKELSRIVGAVPKDTLVGRFRTLGFIK
jgi:thioredoxin 1